MTNQPAPVDAFAGGDTVPSISFKDAPIGTAYTGRVTEAPSVIQARDYETGNPASWPDGNPKMTVVTKIALDSGEERSLWAPKPSSMFAAIKAAQDAAGALIAVGGTLTVTFSGEKPNATNPRLNPQKLYQVAYVKPDAFATTPPAKESWATAPDSTPPTFAQPAAAAAGPTTEQIAAYLASQAPVTPPAPTTYSPEQRAAAAAAGIPLPGV